MHGWIVRLISCDRSIEQSIDRKRRRIEAELQESNANAKNLVRNAEMILGFASRYACLGDLDKWAASRLQVACK